MDSSLLAAEGCGRDSALSLVSGAEPDSALGHLNKITLLGDCKNHQHGCTVHKNLRRPVRPQGRRFPPRRGICQTAPPSAPGSAVRGDVFQRCSRTDHGISKWFALESIDGRSLTFRSWVCGSDGLVCACLLGQPSEIQPTSTDKRVNNKRKV